MDSQTQEIFKAIDSLVDASTEEKEALKEIFHIEGFGGAEDHCHNSRDYRELAEDRLEWLRDQREEGLRW